MKSRIVITNKSTKSENEFIITNNDTGKSQENIRNNPIRNNKRKNSVEPLSLYFRYQYSTCLA